MTVMTCTGPVVGIDSETELITTKSKTPPGVIAGFSSGNQVDLVWWEDWDTYIPMFLSQNPKVKLSFFNLGFDVSVMGEEYFLPELDKDNRVVELMAAYPAKRIATTGWFLPGFTLESLTSELLYEQLDKDESIRLTYKRDMELTDKHLIYLAEDCISTELLGVLLQGMPTESIQARAAYVLSEISRNGMLVDKKFLYEQQAILADKLEKLRKELRLFGYVPKPQHEKGTAVELFSDICKVFGFDDVEECLGTVNKIPAWAFKLLFVILYAHASDKDLPSMVVPDLKDLIFLIKDQDASTDKNKTKKFAASPAMVNATSLIAEILEPLDCLEVLNGLGDAKPTTSAAPWKAFSYIVAKSYESGDCLKNGLVNIHEGIKEVHEDNFGWLSNAPKKVSAKEFLQTHIRKILNDYPDLELDITESAQKNIKNAIKEEAKLAKKEKRPPQPVDTEPLKVYTITKNDKWRLEDCGIDDPFLNVYFEYQHAQKLLSTYMTDKYIDEVDGREHPSFRVYLKTGRTGCSAPNF